MLRTNDTHATHPVEVYTDGSSNNRSVVGWAWAASDGSSDYGGLDVSYDAAVAHYAEALAIIAALNAHPKARVLTDSQHLVSMNDMPRDLFHRRTRYQGRSWYPLVREIRSLANPGQLVWIPRMSHPLAEAADSLAGAGCKLAHARYGASHELVLHAA